MGWLTDLLKDYPALSVAKERLALKEEQCNELKAKIVELQAQVDELTKELEAARAQIGAFQVPEDFTPHDGVLWKKQSSGGYEDTPYCEKCKTSLNPSFKNRDFAIYSCAKHGGMIQNPRKPPVPR
jgi:hypothetical protein